MSIDCLRRKTKDRVGSLVGCNFFHIQCCALILNLIVPDGIKDLYESIFKVHNVARYVKSSPNIYEKFKACVKKEKIQSKSLLCLDVSTRHNLLDNRNLWLHLKGWRMMMDISFNILRIHQVILLSF